MKGRDWFASNRGVGLLATICLVVLATVGGSSSSHAQPAPSISVDAAEYAPGATVTFTATGFVCNEVVGVSLVPGGDLGSFNPSAEGTFSGSFPAPTDPGTYELVADGGVEGCIATVTFEVLAPTTTSEAATTTTSTTTTTTTPATTTTTTTSEVTTSTAEVTTTTAAAGATTPTTAAPLPATGTSDRSITMVAVALMALSGGIALLVVSRRKPS